MIDNGVTEQRIFRGCSVCIAKSAWEPSHAADTIFNPHSAGMVAAYPAFSFC